MKAVRDYKCTERVTMETRAVSAEYPTLAALPWCKTEAFQNVFSSHIKGYKLPPQQAGCCLVAACRLASVVMVGWQLVQSPAELAHTV